MQSRSSESQGLLQQSPVEIELEEMRDSSPAGLLQRYCMRIISVLDDYDKQHPARQSQQVQLCIHEIKLKIVQINATKNNDNVALCHRIVTGMMMSQLDRVFQTDDPVFYRIIKDLINESTVDKDNASLNYTRFLAEHKLSVLHSDQSKDQSKNDCNNVLGELIDSIKELTNIDLKRSANHLVESICTTQRQYPKTFDYKFYTYVMLKTRELLHNPADQDAISDFRYMIDQCERIYISDNRLFSKSTEIGPRSHMLNFINVIDPPLKKVNKTICCFPFRI